MTQGLIVSRHTKKSLHVKSVSDPSPANITRFKTFKQIYQRLIRAAKKLSIAEQLRENASNPKKTWQTLNELLGRKGKSESVSDIKINDEVTNDSSRMANHFNSFFTSVGKKYPTLFSLLQKNLKTMWIMAVIYLPSNWGIPPLNILSRS
jgi:hypothetical protein